MKCLLSICLLPFLLNVLSKSNKESIPYKDYYPKTIETFRVRRYSGNKKVTTGLLRAADFIKQDYNEKDKRLEDKNVSFSSWKEFQDTLQCASVEEELEEPDGIFSLLTAIPPTKDTIELMCAFAETKCMEWFNCRKMRDKLKAGEEVIKANLPILEQFLLLRIIDGKLFTDWPWKTLRHHGDLPGYLGLNAGYYLLSMVVDLLYTNLGDSVFFFGGEWPHVPWIFPFPVVSMTSRPGTSHLTWPWEVEFKLQYNLYKTAESHKNFSDSHLQELSDTWAWEKKIPKAAFYATFTYERSIIIEHASRNPDLFDLSYGNNPPLCWGTDVLCKDYDVNITAYNEQLRAAKKKPASSPINNTDYPFGTGGSTVRYYTNARYSPGHYKYVIVPTGHRAISTSSRLLTVLATCQCVVLLQSTPLRYHISARLKPWVHYVPLSFSGADVLRKVKWLADNDLLAQRIARNGINFAKSYLRYEDYLCYAANMLQALSNVTAHTARDGYNLTRLF